MERGEFGDFEDNIVDFDGAKALFRNLKSQLYAFFRFYKTLSTFWGLRKELFMSRGTSSIGYKYFAMAGIFRL